MEEIKLGATFFVNDRFSKLLLPLSICDEYVLNRDSDTVQVFGTRDRLTERFFDGLKYFGVEKIGLNVKTNIPVSQIFNFSVNDFLAGLYFGSLLKYGQSKFQEKLEEYLEQIVINFDITTYQIIQTILMKTPTIMIDKLVLFFKQIEDNVTADIVYFPNNYFTAKDSTIDCCRYCLADIYVALGGILNFESSNKSTLIVNLLSKLSPEVEYNFPFLNDLLPMLEANKIFYRFSENTIILVGLEEKLKILRNNLKSLFTMKGINYKYLEGLKLK